MRTMQGGFGRIVEDSEERRAGRGAPARPRPRAAGLAALAGLALALCLPGCFPFRYAPAPARAPAAPARAQRDRDAAPRARVVELRWEGVESVPIPTLSEMLRTEAAPELAIWERAPLPAEDVLAADAERIEAYYRRRGYYGAKVQYRVVPGRPGEVQVWFSVVEGAPVRVAERAIRFDVPGAQGDRLAREKLLDDLPLAPGAVFDVDEYGAAKDLLLKRLAERGYLGALLRGGADVDVEAARAHIEWTVQTGPVALQGPIGIEGLEHVEEALVRRTLQAEPGATLSATWFAERQRRLLDLGLFRWATVEPVPQQGDAAAARALWPIAVRVSERPPRTVSLALGYATDERVRARASWEHRNLLGRGRTLRFAARHSGLGSTLESAVDWRDLLQPGVRGELRATASQETLEAFDARKLELRSTLERRLPSQWLGRVSHRFQIADTSAVSASAERVLDEPEQRSVVSVLEASLERSALDVPVDPHRGHSIRFLSGLSFAGLGSSVDFIGSQLDVRAFRPLGPAVLATRLQLGAIVPFGRSAADQIPLTERFFAGGGDSVRGYRFQRLGPLDASSEPLGGTTLLVGSAELRVPLRGRLGAVVFLDAGQVSLEPLTLHAGELRYAAGVGLRFETPVGPVRVDYGYPLNAPDGLETSGRSGGRLHISVGHAF